MPIYEYKCQNGHVTEQIRKHTETTVVCPKCGGDANQLFPGKFVAHGLPNGFLTEHLAYKTDVPNGTPKKKR